MPHSNNAHGLVLGNLKQGLTDQEKKDAQTRVNTFVGSKATVAGSVVSLFDDGNQNPGDAVAAQVDLNIASSPAAHAELGTIEVFMKGDPASIPGTVKHY